MDLHGHEIANAAATVGAGLLDDLAPNWYEGQDTAHFDPRQIVPAGYDEVRHGLTPPAAIGDMATSYTLALQAMWTRELTMRQIAAEKRAAMRRLGFEPYMPDSD